MKAAAFIGLLLLASPSAAAGPQVVYKRGDGDVIRFKIDQPPKLDEVQDSYKMD